MSVFRDRVLDAGRRGQRARAGGFHVAPPASPRHLIIPCSLAAPAEESGKGKKMPLRSQQALRNLRRGPARLLPADRFLGPHLVGSLRGPAGLSSKRGGKVPEGLCCYATVTFGLKPGSRWCFHRGHTCWPPGRETLVRCLMRRRPFSSPPWS